LAASKVLIIEKNEMFKVFHKQHALSDRFQRSENCGVLFAQEDSSLSSPTFQRSTF
jgi:hypothetical protein